MIFFNIFQTFHTDSPSLTSAGCTDNVFSSKCTTLKMKIIAMKNPSSVSVGLQGFHFHGFDFNLSFEIKLNLFFFPFEMQAPFVVIVSDSSKLLPKLLSGKCVRWVLCSSYCYFKMKNKDKTAFLFMRKSNRALAFPSNENIVSILLI